MYYVYLQNGNECRCGMSYGRYQHRYGESECPETCQTQQDKKCGGRWRNSVYRHHFNFTSIVGTPLGRLHNHRMPHVILKHRIPFVIFNYQFCCTSYEAKLLSISIW